MIINYLFQKITEKKADWLTEFGRTIDAKNEIVPLLSASWKKLREIGSNNWRHSSGQPWTVSTDVNIDLIKKLVSSKEKQPHTRYYQEKLPNKQESVGQWWKKKP